MRRTLLSLAGAAALVITLAACGDSDDDDDGRSAGGCTAPGSSFTVGALDELKLDAESYEADAGCVEITYENEGSIAHTLLIKEQTGFKLAVGDTDTGTIELEPGSYTLFCDIAGHEAAGMHAELTVS